MKSLILYLILISTLAFAQPEFSQISSMPGAFARMGFGARGIGMGNAMSAVNEGALVSYYNPALVPFQKNNNFQTTYSILSLDRSLNFLSFTRNFEFYSDKDTNLENRKPRSVAGISVGIINGGVSKIDGRDRQGFKTGELSTSENQFFIGFANRFSEKFSLGIALKIYYYKLYEDVSSTGVGIDIGALYLISNNIKLSFMLTDINSKYKWDTSPVRGQSGANTENKFPLLKKIGLSYKIEEVKLLTSIELENSNAGTNFIRFGIEYNIYENLFLRGGMDRINLSNFDVPSLPSAGFSFFKPFGSIVAGIDYAYVYEPYSSSDRHLVGINIGF